MRLEGIPTVAEVAESWKQQYCHNGKWGSTISGDAGEMHARILACTDLDAIDAVIKNDSWTHPRCDECGLWRRVPLVRFNCTDDDYDSLAICGDCLQKAIVVLAPGVKTP